MQSDEIYAGTIVRAVIGCEPPTDAIIAAAQELLGCNADAGIAPSDPSSPMTGVGAPGGAVMAAGAAGTTTPAPGQGAVGLAQAGMGGPTGLLDAGVPSGGIATGGTTNLPTPSAVMCGAMACPAQASGAACCLNAIAGTCGVMGAQGICSAIGATPTPVVSKDPCPSVDLTRFGYGMLVPCCTTAKQCGVNTSKLPGGMPCTSLADASKTATMMGYGNLIPMPRECPQP